MHKIVEIFAPIFAPIFLLLWALIKPIWLAMKAIYAGFMWLLYAPLTLTLKSKKVTALIKKHTHEDDCIEHLARESMQIKQVKDHHLINDRRREHAEMFLPSAEHPTWYQNVPRHLRRSIVVHGRIRGTSYAPAPMLAANCLTPEFVKSAWSHACFASIRASWLVFVLTLAFVVLSKSAIPTHFFKIDSSSDTTSVRAVSADDVAATYTDVFSPESVISLQKTLREIDNAGADWRKTAAKMQDVIATPLRWLLIILAVALAAAAAGRYVFIGRLRAMVAILVDMHVSNLRKPFREALQKWRYFLADRETNDKGVNDQVHFALNIDRSPLIYFGDASGEMEHNGHLLAPREGHEMCQSVIDMLQHTEVLGGSGESKSRDFYIPVLAQLLELRKKGYPIATYITDEKGAIVEDVINITTKLNMQDDTIIIGTGPDDWRVDLMDAGRPVLIAELIKSASKQAGSTGGGDDFWSEMGNDLMLNIWTITEVAERTRAGEAWAAESGYRLHSIKNALRLATVDANLSDVIDMALHGIKHEYDSIADFDTDAFYAAAEYLSQSWFPLVDATKDGIRANLRKALRTFTFKPEISRGFADGAGPKLLPASELHSNKIKVLNVSQIEHGSAGRLVNIFLKSAFFKQCRDVQQQDPAFAERRLAWWFNPNMADAAKDSYYLEFFLADEYQSLITSDPTSGYSDATVWNVLRSAGVAGVTISQGVGAYEYAIGKDAAANVRRQWRSKHFLRSEDTQTIDEAKKLVGKTMRFQISDWRHFESTAAVRRELGTDPDNLGFIEFPPGAENFKCYEALHTDDIDNFSAWDDAFDVDQRFMISIGNDSGVTKNSTAQAAHWRKEDKDMQTMQHGIIDVDVLRDEQIMQMTRGRALTLLQVAGGTQIDIIRLNAKAYKTFSATNETWS